MEDRCIMCGCIIPEGREVCPQCESKVLKNKQIINDERFLYLMISLAALFSFIVSLLLNWR